MQESSRAGGTGLDAPWESTRRRARARDLSRPDDHSRVLGADRLRDLTQVGHPGGARAVSRPLQSCHGPGHAIAGARDTGRGHPQAARCPRSTVEAFTHGAARRVGAAEQRRVDGERGWWGAARAHPQRDRFRITDPAPRLADPRPRAEAIQSPVGWERGMEKVPTDGPHGDAEDAYLRPYAALARRTGSDGAVRGRRESPHAPIPETGTGFPITDPALRP